MTEKRKWLYRDEAGIYIVYYAVHGACCVSFILRVCFIYRYVLGRGPVKSSSVTSTPAKNSYLDNKELSYNV